MNDSTVERDRDERGTFEGKFFFFFLFFCFSIVSANRRSLPINFHRRNINRELSKDPPLTEMSMVTYVAASTPEGDNAPKYTPAGTSKSAREKEENKK